MRGSKFAILIVLTLATILAAASQTAPSTAKHPFTFKDMMALKRIGAPSVSPDGKWVLFTAMDVNLDENKRINHIWVVPIAGGDAKPLTSDPAGESGARWSPDGKKFLFVSAKGGSQQVWVAEFNPATEDLNGSPTQITHISTEADGAMWSPDGKNIVFTSEVFPGCHDDLCNKSSEEAQAKSKVKAMIFTRLFYRHWNAYTHFKRNHLFVVQAEGGTAKDITPGDHDVPPFSLGGQDLYTVSPDGQEVAFTSNIDEVEATSTNNDVFVVPITGGQPKKLSTSPGGDSTPVYSPDGKWLAWRMQVRPGYESDRFRLVIYDRKAGQIHNLTENVDRWVEAVTWSPDSKTIYFTSEDKGEIPIYSIEIDKPNQVHELLRGANDELQISGDGKTMVFSRMSVRAPNEIFKLAMGNKEPVQLTHVNDPVLAQIMMTPMESFWFTGDTGTKVQGFIIKPPNFNAQRKYPVKFLIHGGPQGQWGDEWSYRWNAELFAADGYVVIMINPRGSTGYGQQFVDGINGDWGGKPYVDLMKGLDYAEQKYPFIAKDRECALGASYGGYMINWLLGHTNRFKCLVSHDGMFNTESAYGSTEELWFPEWEFKGTPWTNREGYRKWSPHEYASQFKTPTLVVHGQLDYRLDISEGFQLFTTLQRLKIPSKMLYFPDEGHWVLKPQNSQLWYNTVNGWVQQWTK
ncbi:MAG TPA: S9 family peptidase [Candidatus Angelobacter sp.]|nr:S9 family peptidase [Candidatus Angelobacter sp.]